MKDTDQPEQIARVSQAIGRHITDFMRAHLNEEFHIDDLRVYVSSRVDGYIAPASPDRILRALRQKGELNYEVVSRSQSLYRSLPVPEPVRIQTAAEIGDQAPLW